MNDAPPRSGSRQITCRPIFRAVDTRPVAGRTTLGSRLAVRHVECRGTTTGIGIGVRSMVIKQSRQAHSLCPVAEFVQIVGVAFQPASPWSSSVAAESLAHSTVSECVANAGASPPRAQMVSPALAPLSGSSGRRGQWSRPSTPQTPVLARRFLLLLSAFAWGGAVGAADPFANANDPDKRRPAPLPRPPLRHWPSRTCLDVY